MGNKKTQYSERYIVQRHGYADNGYESCIENYMDYYDRRGKKYKRLYYLFNVIKLFAATSIPIIEIIFGDNGVGWVVVLASGIAIFSESVIEKFKMKERYLSYRSTCDKLGSEQRMYMTRCGCYKGEKDPLGKYVERVELIIELENGMWKEYMRKQEDESAGRERN